MGTDTVLQVPIPPALLGYPGLTRDGFDAIQAIECLRAEMRIAIDFFNLIDTPSAAWPSMFVMMLRRFDGLMEFIENDCIAWGIEEHKKTGN